MILLLKNSLLVGIGGFAGSVARYLLSVALQKYSLMIPAGTLAANLAGCFIIGVLAQLGGPGGMLRPEARLLLAVGFCGGFTTASSLIYETAQLLRDGEYLHAGGYLLGTVAGGFVVFLAGVALVKGLVKSTGGLWN